MTDHTLPTRILARWALPVLAGLLGLAASAQPVQRASPLSLPVAEAAANGGARTADFIVALVNSEPITNHEVRQRLRRIEQQFAQQGRPLPPREQVLPQVLEQLVNEKAQIQHAVDTGIRVDEGSLLDAERNVAAQNQLSLEALRERLAAEGIDRNRLRNDLRNQILLQRVRDREVESRVQVTEADIDAYISEQMGGAAASLMLDLSHVLVIVPEDASPAQLQTLQARAQQVADRARAGADFAELAREFSDAPERANGGRFGARTADRLPELFVQATRALPTGGVAGPLRSPAGFHILRVNDKGQAGLPPASIVQTRARHILLRTGPQLTEAQAVARLGQYRADILAGRASFEDLARQHSQDGSASTGGDLGWSAPGQFVPEFEQVMNRLQPGDVSPPLVSRFGVHLIRVEQRREVEISQREQREQIRAMLRAGKAEEALELWGEDIRGRAFVEYRDTPQP
ncbi:MAG: peptidylprolyl isomerase [Gammaproteobacteria bacterium]